MKLYNFELVLAEQITDDAEERLFERFAGRVSSAVSHGAPVLYVHLEADSMDDALREAIRGVQELGLAIRRVELDPDTILQAAA